MKTTTVAAAILAVAMVAVIPMSIAADAYIPSSGGSDYEKCWKSKLSNHTGGYNSIDYVATIMTECSFKYKVTG